MTGEPSGAAVNYKLSELTVSNIQQLPGVQVTIHCEDDVVIAGNGILNQTNQAANLQVFGITPTTGTQRLIPFRINKRTGVGGWAAGKVGEVSNSRGRAQRGGLGK